MKNQYTHKLDASKIKLHNLSDISMEITYDKEDLRKMYQEMYTLRKLEISCQELYDQGKIRGFCHLVTGQESIYAAYQFAADKKDTCTTSYRCHGLSLVTGDDPKTILAEMLGKKDGLCGGKGGSMHLYNSNLFGGHGIVGAWVPIALGTAFKHKYETLKKGDSLEKMTAKNAAFTFYGDGAANQGQIFEAYNMAGKWKLPVVFICENNEWGMWTPVNRVSDEADFYKRGQNLPGISVSHENIFDLIAVFKFARNLVLNEQPCVIEIKTFRLCTHSARDSADFRADVNKAVDVLAKFRVFLGDFFTENEISDMEKTATQRILEAVDFAKKSPEPSSAELFTCVLED